jgi:hypothetical protein
MKEISIESICIFGSSARRTNDSLSDKDVLIVSDDSHNRSNLVTSWERDGWSLAAYSPSQIRGMIRHGSLFIQHLKREGQLVTDRGGWLGLQLAEAMPKSTYKIDQRRSIDLIRPVERLGSTKWEGLLAADLSFVFFRNFGIYSLAEGNEYEFDYSKVIAFLASQHKLSNEESDALLSLRERKVAYRNRWDTVVDDFDTALLISICRKVSKSNGLTRIGKSSPIRLFPLRFASLRDAEARLVTLCDVKELDEGCVGKELGSIWKAVTAPRNYSSTIRKIDKTWVSDIEQHICDYLGRATVIADKSRRDSKRLV